MRYLWFVKSLTKLATIALMTAGLIIGVRSHAKVEASQHSLKCFSTNLYCFTPIDYGSGTGQYCTEVTGINNFENIIGTYQKYSTGSGCYGNDSGFQASHPGYTPTGIESDCSCSLLMEGMDDGQSDFTKTLEVGYWVHPPSSTGCTIGSCGFFRTGKTTTTKHWTAIQDPMREPAVRARLHTYSRSTMLARESATTKRAQARRAGSKRSNIIRETARAEEAQTATLFT